MHCMNADLSDLLRLLQNLIRLGTIAEVKGAKARVRLGPTLTTEWLKWATPRAGSTRTWSAPTVGEQVTVMKNLIVKQSTTVEGATALNGGVNAKAGAAGGVAMAVQGTIKATEDVLAGAISLAKHPHGGVRTGSDQSGGPQS